MDDLDRLQHAATHAEQVFSELEQYAADTGFDFQELRAATEEVARLLRLYRAGKLEPGSDTGEFIEGAISSQASIINQLLLVFQRWLALERKRFDACLAWVQAANAHAALRANDNETLSPREFSLEGAEG